MKRIFIGGCPRSGTTLLQSILSMKNDLFTFPETHYFRLGIGRGIERIKSPYYKFILTRGMQTGNRGYFINNCNYIKKIFEHLDELTATAGMSQWLEKTPEHIFYMNDLWKLYPDTLFVLIRRDPESTIASIIDMWKKYRSQRGKYTRFKSNVVDFCYGLYAVRYGCGTLKYGKFFRAYQLWRDAESVIIKNKNHKNVLISKYKDLINSPEVTIRRICEFLSIDFIDGMLHPERNIKKIIEFEEVWKENNKKPISKTIKSKFDSLKEKEKSYLTMTIKRCI